MGGRFVLQLAGRGVDARQLALARAPTVIGSLRYIVYLDDFVYVYDGRQFAVLVKIMCVSIGCVRLGSGSLSSSRYANDGGRGEGECDGGETAIDGVAWRRRVGDGKSRDVVSQKREVGVGRDVGLGCGRDGEQRQVECHCRPSLPVCG